MTQAVINTAFTILGNVSVYHSAYDEIGQLNIIHLLLKRYNFRISEILRLNIDSLYTDKNICVKLSKSKDYIFVRDAEIHDLLSVLFKNTHNHSFTVIYKDVHYFLNRYFSNEIISDGKKNRKVTHAYRYYNARNIKSITDNKQIIKASLRHKSIKSQEYYLKTK